MSEIIENVPETPGTETPGTDTPGTEPTPPAKPIIDQAIESVMDLIDALGLFATIDLTINGKHDELETLTNAMNTIHETLTMQKSYPTGDDWHIVDIATITEPQVIGRSDNKGWIMASNLSVRIITEKE